MEKRPELSLVLELGGCSGGLVPWPVHQPASQEAHCSVVPGHPYWPNAPSAGTVYSQVCGTLAKQSWWSYFHGVRVGLACVRRAVGGGLPASGCPVALSVVAMRHL